jgi:hypothetical protein
MRVAVSAPRADVRPGPWPNSPSRFRTRKSVDRSASDYARNHVCVMLHLRARYDSKAAILTIPATIFAGRKSKSRLNSKGLDR